MDSFLSLFEKRPRTIRFRIVTLVTLILLPLIALFLWMAVEFADAKRDLIELQRFDITSQLSSTVDQKIAEQIGVLRGLAGSDDLKSNRLSDFKKHAEILAAHPVIKSIWAFSSNGNYVEGTEIPRTGASTAKPLQDELVERVFKGNNFVSPVQGEGLQDAFVRVAVPVFDRDSVVYGLAADVSIANLSRLFSDIGIDLSWPAAVVDQKGNFVARSIDADIRVGTPARPELKVAANNLSSFGTFGNTTWEGVEALNAYRRSNLTGWTSVVAVPKSELNAPFQRVISLTLLGAAAILGFTIVLASIMASRISGPVLDLSRFADAMASGRPYRDSNHHLQELDEVRDTLQSAMAKSARLAAVVASSGDAILSVDLDGNIQTWNEGARKLFGYTAEEIVGRPKTLLVPEPRLGEFKEQLGKVVRGESVSAETVRKRKDGAEISVSLNTAPVRQSNGEIIAISSIIRDISERKADEQHRHLLMRELAHRSKNQLAIIQSIANQSVRSASSMTEFLATFQKRLQGIAVSNDLLTSQDWRGAPLEDLVRNQLEILSARPADRSKFQGRL